jgi:hypothetical protein
MFFPCAQGFSKCSDGLGGGHQSISDDGNGNVILAANKQILAAGENTAATPHLASQAAPGNGVRLRTSITDFMNGSATKMRVGSSAVTTYDELTVNNDIRIYGKATNAPSAVQSITAASDSILVNSTHIKVSANSNYLMTGAIAAGSNGQYFWLENVGAQSFQLQEVQGLALISSATMTLTRDEMLLFVYSTDYGVWRQSTYYMNT